MDYNRVLRVEAQIEASVVKRMEMNDGLYIPPNVVLGLARLFCNQQCGFHRGHS